MMLSCYNMLQFRGVIVTATGKGKAGNYDFISRYFGPWNLGLANFEDPVTGMHASDCGHQ